MRAAASEGYVDELTSRTLSEPHEATAASTTSIVSDKNGAYFSSMTRT
jgi:hypothetical protein